MTNSIGHQTAAQDAVTVVELRVENVKRITAARVRPNGPLVTVSGPNGAGKSSLLDALMYAIAGKRARPTRPVREGADHAEIEVDFGRFRVTRIIPADGKPDKVRVVSADGAQYPSPQALLNDMLGELTFDPLEFLRKKPREQAEILRELAGLDLTELDGDEQSACDERAHARRRLEDAESQLKSFPHDPSPPTSEFDVAALTAEYRNALDNQNHVESLETDEADEAEAIADLEQRLAERRRKLESIRDELDDARKGAMLSTRSLAEITADINNAKETNARFERERSRAGLAGRVEGWRVDLEKAEKRVASIRQERADLIAAAQFPLDGLSIGDGEVIFNGVPLEQASQAEGLLVTASIGMALNPTVRVMRITDGSLLDSTSFDRLRGLAEERGYQIWVERVADAGSGVGIVIEDGGIVSGGVGEPEGER